MSDQGRHEQDQEGSPEASSSARAVDNATGEHLIDGSVHDVHAEISPDPELDGSRSGDPDPTVTDAHRDQVEAVEQGDRQATSGALGETADSPD